MRWTWQHQPQRRELQPLRPVPRQLLISLYWQQRREQQLRLPELRSQTTP